MRLAGGVTPSKLLQVFVEAFEEKDVFLYNSSFGTGYPLILLPSPPPIRFVVEFFCFQKSCDSPLPYSPKYAIPTLDYPLYAISLQKISTVIHYCIASYPITISSCGYCHLLWATVPLSVIMIIKSIKNIIIALRGLVFHKQTVRRILQSFSVLTAKVKPNNHSWANPCLIIERAIRRLVWLFSVF